jgi:hypothetical protein
MDRIIITVPQEGKKWKLSGNGTKNKSFASPTSLFNWLEKSFRVARLKTKKVVRVHYATGVNESISSDDSNYLLYAAMCFMEDYLSKKVLLRGERDYLKKENLT